MVVVQWVNHVWLFETPWTAVRQAPLSSTISQSLLRFMSIESVTLSNCLILCHPLLLLSSIFPRIRVFSNESALRIRWELQLQLQQRSFQWIFKLISFRIDWFDLLAVQGNLKSFLQHQNLKASLLWYSAFFMVLTLTSVHDYWKNHTFVSLDLCRQSDVSAF